MEEKIKLQQLNKERLFFNDLKRTFQNTWIDIDDKTLEYLAKKNEISNFKKVIKKWRKEEVCTIAYSADMRIRHFMFTR